MNIVRKLNILKSFLIDIRKIDDPKYKEWLDDLTNKVNETFTNRYKGTFLIESRIKDKDKFIIKTKKSLYDENINSNIDLFGIRITCDTSIDFMAEILDRLLNAEGVLPKNDCITRKKKDIYDKDSLVGTINSIRYHDLSLEFQVMSFELRDYINKTHDEYDRKKYGKIIKRK